MRTQQNRETLKAIFTDRSPLDMNLIPVPDRRDTLENHLRQEREKFVAIERVRGKNNERDLSR